MKIKKDLKDTKVIVDELADIIEKVAEYKTKSECLSGNTGVSMALSIARRKTRKYIQEMSELLKIIEEIENAQVIKYSSTNEMEKAISKKIVYDDENEI